MIHGLSLTHDTQSQSNPANQGPTILNGQHEDGGLASWNQESEELSDTPTPRSARTTYFMMSERIASKQGHKIKHTSDSQQPESRSFGVPSAPWRPRRSSHWASGCTRTAGTRRSTGTARRRQILAIPAAPHASTRSRNSTAASPMLLWCSTSARSAR